MYAPWQIILATFTFLYVSKNALLLSGLNAPEPYANFYNRNYYRATWILTALDAGFWTAFNIRPKWFRHFCSLLFSIYYLVFDEEADEKVRRLRSQATVEMLRESWEKMHRNPILRLQSYLSRPKLKIERQFKLARPDSFAHAPRPISVYLYFHGSEQEFACSNTLIYHIHGGGFVTMNPKCHESYVTCWAQQTGFPVISIDYGKAPEYPYPFALEECLDLYRLISTTNGACLGMKGWKSEIGGKKRPRRPLKIILVGDSAGGNIACGLILKLLEWDKESLNMPKSIVMIYPLLDVELACWLPQEHVKLLRVESSGQNIMKVDDKKPQLNPVPSMTALHKSHDSTLSIHQYSHQLPFSSSAGTSSNTELALTSRMANFMDRLISPEVLRSMALLYIAASKKKPQVTSDYFLSPVLAPLELLSKFPRVYMICGEKDPFVDDVVIFSGLLKQAKREFGNHEDYIKAIYKPEEIAKVRIISGMSHAFLNLTSIVPESRTLVKVIGDWFSETVHKEELKERQESNYYRMKNPLKNRSMKSEFHSSDTIVDATAKQDKGDKTNSDEDIPTSNLKKHKQRDSTSLQEMLQEFVSGQAFYHANEAEIVTRRIKDLTESLKPPRSPTILNLDKLKKKIPENPFKEHNSEMKLDSESFHSDETKGELDFAENLQRNSAENQFTRS